jgi:hypothetical protein
VVVGRDAEVVHYVPFRRWEVHLYGSERPPSWVHKLPLDIRLVYHNDAPLFGKETVAAAFARIDRTLAADERGEQAGWEGG